MMKALSHLYNGIDTLQDQHIPSGDGAGIRPERPGISRYLCNSRKPCDWPEPTEAGGSGGGSVPTLLAHPTNTLSRHQRRYIA